MGRQKKWKQKVGGTQSLLGLYLKKARVQNTHLSVANTSTDCNKVGRWGTACGMSPTGKEPRAPQRICSTWTLPQMFWLWQVTRPLRSSTFKARYLFGSSVCLHKLWYKRPRNGKLSCNATRGVACTCTHPSHQEK